MSINPVNDSQATMNLGVVTINNERYIAILHFKTPEGENRLITENIKKTHKVALGLFQDVINKYAEDQVVEKVSEAGFSSNGKLIASHEDLKTTQAWEAFIAHLNSPMMLDDEEDDDKVGTQETTSVDLLNLGPLDNINDNKAFGWALYKKIRDAKDQPFPTLTDIEKLFLQDPERVVYQYPQFLAGKHDAKELNYLFLEFRQIL